MSEPCRIARDEQHYRNTDVDVLSGISPYPPGEYESRLSFVAWQRTAFRPWP